MAWEREGEETAVAGRCGTSFVILAGETVGYGAFSPWSSWLEKQLD